MGNYKPRNVGPTLVEIVVKQMEEDILSSQLFGQKLASEKQLCEKYGVSRVVIREVLTELSSMGLVRKVVGSGSYITRPEPKDVAKLLLNTVRMNNIPDIDVFQMRVLLETEAVRLTAQRITDSQINELEEIVDFLEENFENVDVKVQADIEFHVKLCNYCGSKLLAIVIKSMASVFAYMIRKSSFVGANESPLYGHRQILHAIANHDAELAAYLTKEHLQYSYKNLIEKEESSSLE